jgi:hypothetical protein
VGEVLRAVLSPTAFPLKDLLEVGSTGTQWVDVTNMAVIDATKGLIFADGTLKAAVSAIGIFDTTTGLPYTFVETSPTSGFLKAVREGDWTFTDVAAYVYSQADGTITFTDVDESISTFGAGTIYAVKRTLPFVNNGVYSLTDGNGIEIPKGQGNAKPTLTYTALGSVVVFSNSDEVFDTNLSDQSNIPLYWLGNKLYADKTSTIYDLGTLSITSNAFTLNSGTPAYYELRTVPANLTSGTNSGVWEPYNFDDTSLYGAGASNYIMKLKFASSGTKITFENGGNSADVDPLSGVSTNDVFYVLSGNHLYAGTAGSEELIGTYSITDNAGDDELRFTFDPSSGAGYGAMTDPSTITLVGGDGEVAYFK